jgi:hypothetical protein
VDGRREDMAHAQRGVALSLSLRRHGPSGSAISGLLLMHAVRCDGAQFSFAQRTDVERKRPARPQW